MPSHVEGVRPQRSPIDRRALLAVFVGGCAGALARVGLDRAVPPSAGHWPWATFAINVSGCLALGVVSAALAGRSGPRVAHLRALLATGVCGTYTTFATMQLELFTMLRDGRAGLAAGVWLAVAGLGGAGALLRFSVAATVALRVRSILPLGTLAVNASASLVLGLLAGAGVTGTALLLAGTATLGSYSTFSTWIFESHRLVEQDEPRAAATNLIASLAVGLGAAALGYAIGAGGL